MKTPPVLLLIYRRSDLLRQLIDSLREVKPDRIYVAGDGPRADRADEARQCEMARKALSMIDWECEVKTLLRSHNLGVFQAVSQAIDWFFTFEEQGIILEEDCIPHGDFFKFCGDLLGTYRNSPLVMQVSGTNFQPKSLSGGASYFLSRYNHVWGWATWRRAWAQYRRNMEGLEQFLKDADCTGFWESSRERKYWHKIFLKTQAGQVQSWAYRWTFSIWANGGLCIYPEANLVSNRGFGKDATHTFYRDRLKSDRPTENLKEVVHPNLLVQNRNADHWTFERMYWGTPLARLGERFRKVMKIANEAFFPNRELSIDECETNGHTMAFERVSNETSVYQE